MNFTYGGEFNGSVIHVSWIGGARVFKIWSHDHFQDEFSLFLLHTPHSKDIIAINSYFYTFVCSIKEKENCRLYGISNSI